MTRTVLPGWGAALFALLLGGCSGEAQPRPEWIVSVSTDAPVPQLGDRLLIETLTEDGKLACAGCRRVIAAGEIQDFPVSFSVVPSGQRLLLRTRLYRARIAGPDGEPGSAQLIENVGWLPETATRLKLAVALSLKCFGVPADWDARAACSPNSGKLTAFEDLTGSAALLPGAAGIAAVTPCASAAPAGMRCLPGGLFLRGDEGAVSLLAATNARPEQLTRLNRFFLDEDEVTVGAVRALLRAGVLDDAPASHDESSSLTAHCTYLDETDDKNDEYPLNCVTLAQAKSVCAALQKRLPTEAEWEYAAGNLGRETAFPWGSEPDICPHAVVGRAELMLDRPEDVSGACLSQGEYEPLTGPVAGGHPLDVTDQGIKNLAGNLSELVADAFGTYTAPCWGDASVLDNPRCDTTDVQAFPVSLRGSAWANVPLFAAAAQRSSVREGASGAGTTGFRCARDAE